MPNAMLEAVNTWSAETLGDFLFLEKGDVWILNLKLEFVPECVQTRGSQTPGFI
jgi:hypothetical protein